MLVICERFGKLPSEVLAEDAGLLRMLELESMAKRAEEGPPSLADGHDGYED